MKAIILILAVFALSSASYGQQRGILSNFLLNNYYYNPAIAGSKNVHVANISYRNQWVGFDGAPTLLMGNFYGSVKNQGKMGYGVSVVSEKIGLTNNTSVYLNYAHHFKMSETVKLGLGVQPGLMQYRVRLYDAQLADENDEVLTGNVYTANAIDFSAGFNLYSDKFFVMGSIHHLLGKQIKFTSYNSNLDFHYNAIAGYNIKFKKKKFELQPSVMLKYTKPVPYQFTGMLKGTFSQKYWVGLLYRTSDAVGISLGMNIKERISVGYGYDYTLSNLSKYQNGSHEITLSFVVTKNKPSLVEEDDKLNNSILDEMKKDMEEEKKKKEK